MKNIVLSALVAVSLLSVTPKASALSRDWLRARDSAVQALKRNDLVTARAQLALSLNKATALPIAGDRALIEQDILRLNNAFRQLWGKEAQAIIIKAAQQPNRADGMAMKKNYIGVIKNDQKALTAFVSRELGNEAFAVRSMDESAKTLTTILSNDKVPGPAMMVPPNMPQGAKATATTPVQPGMMVQNLPAAYKASLPVIKPMQSSIYPKAGAEKNIPKGVPLTPVEMVPPAKPQVLKHKAPPAKPNQKLPGFN